jgi:hypothetical protein
VKKLAARVSISRPLNRDTIVLTVEDDLSSTQIVEVTLTMADFAAALTGQGHMPGTAEWRGLHLLGKTREHKVEEGVTRDNLHTFEVDGWEAREGDLGNYHRKARDGSYRVTFVRHV